MMKYEAPEINVIVFEVEDVIATSGLAAFLGDNEIDTKSGWWN